MSKVQVFKPIETFLDVDGDPLADGYIFIGAQSLNPELSPIQVYWDAAMAVPAAQPIRTIGGYPSNAGVSSKLYIAQNFYSIRIKNKHGTIISDDLNASSPDSSSITFIQSGSGSVERNAQDKMREIISVTDKGAVSGGVVNCTAAFLAAGIDAYVPVGDYLVDADEIEVARYWGPGRLLTSGGAVIALNSEVQGTPYSMRKIMEPFYGFNNGTTNTEIYSGAQFAPQGLAYHRDPVTGVQRMFISQSVGAGADWGPDEYVRITEFLMREDGGVQNNTQFTPELRSSHAHLSALTDTDGKLYMYQSWRAPIGTVDLNAGVGKGWSKMEWKGTGNVDADIVNYQVWGNPGSGHPYQYFGKGCTQVSQDGKYMIIIGINYSPSSGGRTLFIYDRKQVEAMADPLLAEPIYASKPLDNFAADGETAYQGETSDGRYIYVTWGSGSVFGRRGISIYELTGEKIRDIYFEGPSEQYTDAELMYHPTLGQATAFEPEGLTIRGDEIFVTFTDFFRTSPDVVTFEGVKYANLQGGNVGQQPDSDQLHWKITSAAATLGAWNPATVYNVGNTTKRSKIIYSIRPTQGAPDEMPCSSKYVYPYSIAQFPGNASILVNASHDLGSTWRVCSHIVPTDIYRTSFDYRYGYTFAVFDQRTGSDNTVRAALRMSTTDGSHVASVIGGDGTSAGGPSLNLFPATSPSNPGSARITTSGIGDLRLMTDGNTKFAVNTTENVSYQPLRPLNTNAFTLGASSRVWSDVFSNQYTVGTGTVRILSGSGTPEGVVTAVVGSTFQRSDGGASTTLYVKQSGTGNTGWVAK